MSCVKQPNSVRFRSNTVHERYCCRFPLIVQILAKEMTVTLSATSGFICASSFDLIVGGNGHLGNYVSVFYL
jgi:hypothetical protein